MSNDSPILNSGGPPPQNFITWELYEEGMLLFAAWAHGMSTGEIVHRYTLFAYIQSHVANKSEENLQNVLENSPYWVGVNNGKYKLTDAGNNVMISDFGHRPKKADLESKYIFSRQYKGHTFSVIVDPAIRRLTVLIDDDKTRGVDACRFMKNLGATFITDSSSQTRKVLNWIIQDNDFLWERTY